MANRQSKISAIYQKHKKKSADAKSGRHLAVLVIEIDDGVTLPPAPEDGEDWYVTKSEVDAHLRTCIDLLTQSPRWVEAIAALRATGQDVAARVPGTTIAISECLHVIDFHSLPPA